MTDGREVAATTGPVGYALAQAARAHRAEMQERIAGLGLHVGQELLIIDIHHHPDTTQGELVQRIGIEQPTIARALSRMQRTGFVQRFPDPDDRRVIRLRLTERGAAVVKDVLGAWTGLESRSTAELSDSEVAQLTSLLNKIRDNLT